MLVGLPCVDLRVFVASSRRGAEEGEMISGVTSKLMKIPPILLLVFIISISNRKFYDIKSTLLSSLVFSLPLLYKTFSGFGGV